MSSVENVIAKTETLALEKVANKDLAKEEANSANGTKPAEVQNNGNVQEEKVKAGKEPGSEISKAAVKKEEVAVEVEPETGVSIPVRLDDGKQLNCVGLSKKSILGIGVKIYGFGIYADNKKLKDLLKSKIGKAPAKLTKEIYQVGN